MLEYLTTVARHLRKELRARRELRELLEQDDRILRDIGLTRTDVESALSRPIGIGARREAFRLARHSLTLDRAL
jgi:uncharacterized protein YjiS (DUF1127 family)